MYQGRDFGVGTLKYISVSTKIYTFCRFYNLRHAFTNGFNPLEWLNVVLKKFTT